MTLKVRYPVVCQRSARSGGRSKFGNQKHVPDSRPKREQQLPDGPAEGHVQRTRDDRGVFAQNIRQEWPGRHIAKRWRQVRPKSSRGHLPHSCAWQNFRLR